MNLLARAKLSISPIFLSPSPRIRLFPLRPVTAFRQCNFYSTRTPRRTPKTQQFTTDKSSEPPSISDKIKKQTGPSIVWPKPKEIPYQAKAANFINLIGYVKSPIQFEASSDGKHLAATVISYENSVEKKSSLLIPVVFEGDLAHVVACHVKENDCVFVSGQLSIDPLRGFMFSESLGSFHVVAENLNFVEGFKFKRSGVSSNKIGVSFLNVKVNEPQAEKVEEEEVIGLDSDEDFNQQWKNALEHAKEKGFSGVKSEWAPSVSVENSVKPLLNNDSEAATLVDSESKAEKVNEKSGYTVSKKNNGDSIFDLWRDLVKNPLLWWDYRGHKAKGLVKEKYPDFKHKGTGQGLWLDTAPKWVLPGFEKLEFDIKEIEGKQVEKVEGFSEKKTDKGEDYWRDLVENPNKWWDNRLNKRNPRAPDFKHKETGQGLWVGNTPNWALSRLPPMKDGQNAV